LQISKIAPLPDAAPYTVTSEGQIRFFGDSQGDLDLINDRDFLQDMKMMSWTPHPIDKNPFDSDSPSSAEATEELKAPSVSEKSTAIKIPETSEIGMSRQECSNESLTEIDLRYLANQNRMLLYYVDQNQRGVNKPAPTTFSSPHSGSNPSPSSTEPRDFT
jgi:hypothetical protein